MAEIEAHDEVVEWFDELSESDWERTSVVIDRLAMLGSKARMPLSRSLGDGVFNNERTEVTRARKIAQDWAKRNP